MNAPRLRSFVSRAPTRIDLCGGTVDIWPLYLFLPRATTVNLAIDLYAETRLDETATGRITLVSGDQGTRIEFGWNELDTVKLPHTLELHAKYLRHFLKLKKKAGTFEPSQGITITTSARSPAGAGLGGSSTLSVSIIGALQHWAVGSLDVERDGQGLTEVTRDVETTVIQVPAGMQDYYGAMFGGLQSLRWGTATHERHRWDASILGELEDRILLFYSGQSRNSGINNWALFKAFIDGVGGVREQFTGITKATHELEAALEKRDWKAVGQAIANEWSVRRGLASGITTPEIDQAFAHALKNGATAGKICGAGGGGCFFVYLPEKDPDLREKLTAEIGALPGIRPLPFRAWKHGLQVEAT